MTRTSAVESPRRATVPSPAVEQQSTGGTAEPGGATVAAPGGVERARRLGHRIDRLALPLEPLSAPPRVQRLFSEGHARSFVEAHTPDPLQVDQWPNNVPNNVWNWFRTRPQVPAHLAQDGRWSEDVPNQPVSQQRMVDVVTALFAQVAEERARLAEVARQQQAQVWADAVPQNRINHVFLGDFNGVNPTGYHSKAGNSPTHEAYGPVTALGDGFGSYQQSVRGRVGGAGPWRRKGIQSTFFPDQVGGQAATENDVKLALGTAEHSMQHRVSYPVPWRDMVIRKLGDTWFPAGGDDHLEAEALP